MIFYTSNLHFGHANAIKFDDRPFADVDEMTAGLIHNWNGRVGKNDTVCILGDFSFRLKDPEPILARLKGHKRLILGNHDQVIMGSEKLQSYFDDIQKMDYVSDRDKLIVMCHFPIAEWNKKNRVAPTMLAACSTTTCPAPQTRSFEITRYISRQFSRYDLRINNT